LKSNNSEQRRATITEAACPLMVPEYEELTPCLKEVTKIWEQMINTPDRSVTKFDYDVLTDAVRQGSFWSSFRDFESGTIVITAEKMH